MSTQKRDHSIEFLRVLAIILIIASHCKILEQGGVGNCIFFALSGFFIVAPFKEDTELAFLSPKEWLRYIGKRLLRVLPAYYTYLIAITYLLGLLHVNDFETVASLPLHLCFYMASGHLWFIQQEMLFFLLCPLLMCLLGAIRLLLKKRKVSDAVSYLILAGALILLCVLSLRFLQIMLHGNNTLVRFMPERIMAGMVFGYMVKALRLAFPQLGEKKALQFLTDGYVILFVLFCLLSSEWVLSRFNPAFAGYYIGWSNPFLCIILTGIALVLLALTKTSPLKKVLSHPIIGKLGELTFCLYLFHVPFISLLDNGSRARTFLLVFFVTLGIAVLVHNGIEKPVTTFFKRERKDA